MAGQPPPGAPDQRPAGPLRSRDLTRTRPQECNVALVRGAAAQSSHPDRHLTRPSSQIACPPNPAAHKCLSPRSGARHPSRLPLSNHPHGPTLALRAGLLRAPRRLRTFSADARDGPAPTPGPHRSSPCPPPAAMNNLQVTAASPWVDTCAVLLLSGGSSVRP